MSTDKRHIFLVGPSGVGKTTIAREVAKLAELNFVDLDDAISKEVGVTISQYFAENGEAKFREVERQVLAKIAQGEAPVVLATGGGTVLDSRNIVEMQNNGLIVYLSALEKDLVERVGSDTTNERPLLEGDVASKIHEQLENRRECYELASDITVATSRREIGAVAEAVLRQCNRLNGTSSDLSSSIVVGENILSTIGSYLKKYQRAVLISQESIPESYSADVIKSLKENGIEVLTINVPDGETAKSFETYASVIEQMRKALVPRSACVIALGGGVVGDLSGFVAASYHRGIDVVQVPTTLLAQVDSSIGGKCGINLKNGKNLVGAFHQPKLIIADTAVLNSLSEDDFLSGLGEVAKYALLGNQTVSALIEDHSDDILKRDPKVLVPLIKSCMNQKLNVVSRDPLEKNGLRATLNLGHTLAHAIETQTKYSIAHGQAVTLGLRFIVKLSFAMGLIPQSQADSSLTLIDSLKLTSEIPQESRSAKALIDLMYSDKKSNGSLSFVLMTVGGGSELSHDVDREIVEKTLLEFISDN